MKRLATAFAVLFMASAQAETLTVWPDLAPGETTRLTGTALDPRPTDKAPITRVKDVTSPTLEVFLASPDKASGASVLILPGGGFRYVVPDLEGSEAAEWLNELGIAAFVLNYRTIPVEGGGPSEPWKKPLQDSQRAIRLIRAMAESRGLDAKKVGLLGFSAGGQVAALHLTSTEASYQPVDAIDAFEFAPNFNLLVYPWKIGSNDTGELMPQITVHDRIGPTFIVHTHDDQSNSLGPATLYMELKRANVSAELHVYQNGGHGYGTRERENSVIGTWTERGRDWLRVLGY